MTSDCRAEIDYYLDDEEGPPSLTITIEPLQVCALLDDPEQRRLVHLSVMISLLVDELGRLADAQQVDLQVLMRSIFGGTVSVPTSVH